MEMSDGQENIMSKYPSNDGDEEVDEQLHPAIEIFRNHLLSEIEAENALLGANREDKMRALDFYGERSLSHALLFSFY